MKTCWVLHLIRIRIRVCVSLNLSPLGAAVIPFADFTNLAVYAHLLDNYVEINNIRRLISNKGLLQCRYTSFDA
jgi:galactitol-specific phosphotransferase system IIC component